MKITLINAAEILLFILNWIAAVTLYLIIISIGQHLITSNIIIFKYNWISYLYYFGLGILAYYPSNYILHYKFKTLKK